MNVCMISGSIPSSVGGVERVVDALSKFLVSREVDVTIIGRDARDFVKKSFKTKCIGVHPFDWTGEHIHLPKKLQFVYRRLHQEYAYSFKVWKIIQHEPRFDIIHGHGGTCFFPLLFRTESPFIITFHGTLAGAFSERNSAVRNMVSYLDKIAAEKCDVAIACSRAVKNELVNFYGVNPNKVKVIHNGVDTEKFRREDKIKSREKLGLPSKKKYGIWVGSDPIRKGLPIAIKAVRGFDNASLLVVGVSGRSDPEVIFFGRVSNAKLRLLYSSADFLIMPSMYEGFTLVPLEAMACGVPIIVSKQTHVGEIIDNGVEGFIIYSRDYLCYREKIELMIHDDRTLDEMSDRCRSLAERYSWAKQAEKYWDVYRNLAGS